MMIVLLLPSLYNKVIVFTLLFCVSYQYFAYCSKIHTESMDKPQQIESSNTLLSLSILLLKQWLAGGLANAITSGLLNPMDVTKTRLQSKYVNNQAAQGNSRMFSVLYELYKEDGIIGLWKPGLTASITREMVNSGVRAGCYSIVRDFVNKAYYSRPDQNSHLLPKIIASMITGTLGAILSNPIDVVKIRLMANPKQYPSTFGAFPIIFKAEGMSGFWKGLYPSTLRGAFIAAGELATYDHAKIILKDSFGFSEGSGLHVTSSLITGLVATTVAAPFDLLKTRAMNEVHPSSNPNLFRILFQVIKEEGVMVLFRGWIPAYLRLGPHAMIAFPIFERLRVAMGLEYL